jgi:VIT1/CCC1 family predicted Fe2+/Mn2+ transporter
MEKSIKIGVSFGLTSGVITTLGLMVGLHSGTHSVLAVVGGILTIAIADALSDALGIHISEESSNRSTHEQVWVSTVATFLSKFFMALTFVVPVALFPLGTAIWVSIFWGLGVVAFLSYYIARSQDNRPIVVIGEHLAIAVLVLVITHFVGVWVARVIG